MIVSVRGSLEGAGADWVNLQVGGVTLQVFVPASDISDLGPLGGQVRLFTHLRLRDEQPVLYGFSTTGARDLFLMLLSVSGIGPRLSLSLLSSLGVAPLQQAIVNEDVAALTAAPGVGRRLAGRVVLELKAKLETGQPGTVPPAASEDGQVIEALMALGYSALEARRAVNGLRSAADLPLEERIRLALKRLGTGG